MPDMFHEEFMPHGYCLLWEPWLIWSSALSDIAIGVAYFSIPIALAYLVKKRPDIPHSKLLWLFALFTMLCGVTHLLGAVTLWAPLYYLDVGVKVATAITSVFTAIVIWPIMPAILAVPSQKELQDAKNRLDAAQRIVGVGSWEWTVATGGLVWSDEFYRIYGRDPDTFTPSYEGFLAAVHPGDREKVKEAVEQAVRGEKRYHIVHRIVLPTGEEKVIEEQGEVERDETGAPVRMVGVGHDITQRRLVEKALNDALKTSNAAQRIAGVGSWEWTVATGGLVWSDEFYRIYGQNPETFTPTYEGFLGTVHPDDRERVKEAVGQAVRGEKRYHVEHRIVRPDGGERYIEERGEVERDETGVPVRMVGVGHDVTDLKKAQTERERLHRLHADLAKRSPVGAYYFIDDGEGNARFTYVSPRFCALLGIEERAVLDNPAVAFDACHPDDIDDLVRANGEALRTLSPLRWEGRFMVGEEIRWIRIDSDGAPLPGGGSEWSGAVIDLTEWKASQEALIKAKVVAERATRDAEAANKAKSDFLANMSHELRTPLNGVIGVTEILLDGELRGHQRKQLELVKTSGDTLLALVNDVLDLARIEAGRFALNIAPFNLIDLIEETGTQHAVLAHGRGLELIVSVAEGAPSFLMGDANRLRQVIVNLLGNAIKFTHTGEVSLQVAVEEETGHDALLHFAIRDSGIGIPKDKLATIFQRFTQGDESVTRQYGGAGLGTTIAKQFVELMGGEIWVESEVGKGTTFHFTARFARCDDIEETIPSPPEELRSLRALIVDDNETNRVVLHNIVSSWGMGYVEAASGAEAIEKIGLARQRHENIDIILMDYNMPGYDGVEAAQMIRASRQGPRPLIILLSSVVGGLEERIHEADIDGFITKPIRRSVLLNMILTRLGKESATKVTEGEKSRHIPSDKVLSILLVEDSEVNREVARYALGQIDHTLDHAMNGADGVAMWKRKKYDLILMDIHMPVMDGLEATRLIREEEEKSGGHTPIIALTARAMEQDRLDCIAAGMDDYIAKPIKKGDLVAKVVDLLHFASPPAPTASPTGGKGMRFTTCRAYGRWSKGTKPILPFWPANL